MDPAKILAGIGALISVSCSNEAKLPDGSFISLDPESSGKINIVLINLDDSGFGDFSFKGAVGYSTPNVDSIASEGLNFTNYYSAQPISGASRAALLTGCYSNRIGLTMAPMPGSHLGLAKEEQTIAELLKDNGYATALVGKWHVGDAEEFLPTHEGFDEFYGLPYSNDMWPNHPTMDFGKLPFYDGQKVQKYVETYEDMSQLTTLYTERSISFIKRNVKDGKPFFLYLAHNMPHVPLAVSEKFAGKSKAGLYGDVMMELDWSIGQIARTLKELKIADRTLLIITSDNGPWCNYGNHAGSTGGLREGKSTTFNGGLRVPCIFYMPGHVHPGLCNALISNIDFLPTICSMTGTPGPKLKIDGADFMPYLTGRTSEPARKYLHLYFHDNSLEAVTDGIFKMVFPHQYQSYETYQPGMDGKPGQLDLKEVKDTELYDLRQDPGERRNVMGLHPDKEAELLKAAEDIRKELGDDLLGIEGTGRRKPGYTDKIQNNL